MRVLRKSLGIPLRFCAQVMLVVMVLPVFYLLEPFYKIRIGTMFTQRFAHLALNAEIFFRKMKLHGIPPRTRYLFFGHDPANRQLMEMWKRLDGFPVRFIESHWGTRILFAWRPILQATRFWEAKSSTYKEFGLFAKTGSILSFTEEEEERGRRGLAAMGIGEDDWFVLFHARDNAFLDAWRPELADHWKTIAFRNSNIENYLPAAEYIASLGGYALRFGAGVEKPLPDLGNPRIIDYSTEYRTDFMDIYLGAKCRFFLGSSAGPDALANIFNVPLLSANHTPYNNTRYHPQSIIVPRLIRNDGRRLTYWEAKEAGFHVGWDNRLVMYAEMDTFEEVETEPDDIVDGVKDMIDALEGREPPRGEKEIQDLYGELYLSQAPEYRDGARIGARFAMRYRDLIVPPGHER